MLEEQWLAMKGEDGDMISTASERRESACKLKLAAIERKSHHFTKVNPSFLGQIVSMTVNTSSLLCCSALTSAVSSGAGSSAAAAPRPFLPPPPLPPFAFFSLPAPFFRLTTTLSSSLSSSEPLLASSLATGSAGNDRNGICCRSLVRCCRCTEDLRAVEDAISSLGENLFDRESRQKRT